MAFSTTTSSISIGPRTGSGGLSGGSTFRQGNRVGGGGLNYRTGSGIPSGNRTGSGGLGGGSTFQIGQRVGSGGLGGGSTFAVGNRVGSGGLNARTGNSIPFGQRVGSGGLNARTGASIPFGQRVGAGGLGARTGASIPFGNRIGAGGLNYRTGNSIPFGNRVGDGGLNYRTGNSIPFGNRIGSGGLSRTGTYDLGGSRDRSGLPPQGNRTGIAPPSGNNISGGGLGGGGGGGLGGGPIPVGSGNKVPDPVISPGEENFRETKCGNRITGKLQLVVSQKFDAQGMLQPPATRVWTAVVEGKTWTPQDWQPCTPPRVRSQPWDTIGYFNNGDGGATSISVETDLGEISDGCFVNLDQPSHNGTLLTRKISKLTVGAGQEESEVLDIRPGESATTVFAKPATLSPR